MINNVKEDGKAFVLTANHCPLAPNNVAVYNYQSSLCKPSIDSTFAHSINGLTIISRWSKSDFLLVEMSSKPPNNFNPFYAGWNNTGDIPLKTVGIHHPRGDVKKISFNFKPSLSSGYYSSGIDHWKVSFWDEGTTENVSSGSPLFDEHKNIVGQLHGGDASCQSPEEEDYYGKFSYSWNSNSDSLKQLKYWLDPDNTGATVIPGYDPTVSKANYDLALFGFSETNLELCGKDSISPAVLIKNRGLLAANKFEVIYYLNNIQYQSEVLNVTLQPNDFLNYTPTPFHVNDGFYNLKAEVRLLGVTDGNSSNNYAFTEVSVVNASIQVELTLKTDNDGNETSWELLSSTGNLLYSGGGFASIPGGKIYKDTFCLYSGCFTFNIFDEYGDGICCDFGKGFYVLKNLLNGDTIVKDFNFKSSDTSHSFCLGDSCSIRARGFIKHSSSSGVSDGEIDLEMLSGMPPFSFNWSNGESTQTIDSLSSGIYSVLIQDSLNCADSLFFEVGIGTGIVHSEHKEKSIIVYPNPTTASITISGLNESEIYSLEIRDMSSRLLLSEYQTSASGKIKLDLINLDNGFYLLTITGKTTAKTIRILKNR